MDAETLGARRPIPVRHSKTMTLTSRVALAAWLGPWAGSLVPGGVTREAHRLEGERTMSVYVYRGAREPHGIYVVTPGMHFLGPDDPRLDRFCRVLARAGFVVVAPLLPDFLSLAVAPTTTDDLAMAFDFAADRAERESLPAPMLFSISFGSQPAIALAAREGYRDRLGALLLFGGYADFESVVRFSVTGRVAHAGKVHALPRDPLNSPVVFMNLLPFLDTEADRDVVRGAWREMVEQTWGKMELKEGRAREPFARAIAAKLAPKEKVLFLAGCGLHPSAPERLEEGLEGAGDAFAFADPRPDLARIRAPITLVHGRDDDVIPFFEAEKLAAALPPGHPHEVLLTGMYGHTGTALPKPKDIAAELKTMLRVVSSLART